MSTYAGRNCFPVDFTEADDAVPHAGSVNVGIEALADRTVHVKKRILDLGQAPAMNFITEVTSALSWHAKYNATTRTWYAVQYSDEDKFVRTTDPSVWPSSTEITGGALQGIQMWDFDVSPAGKIVVYCRFTENGWFYNGASWSTFGGDIGSDPDHPGVVYEPVSGRWIVGGAVSGLEAALIGTSEDGTSWTPRTVPAGYQTGTTLSCAQNGLGQTLLYGITGAGNAFITSRSTDGGLTWSPFKVTEFGFSFFTGQTRNQKPVWTGDEWLVNVANEGVANPKRTKVYASSDGLTWTLRANLTSVALTYMATLPKETPKSQALVCAISQVGDILVSADAGKTWFFGPRQLGGITGISASRSQFLITGTSKVYPGSVAHGYGVAPVT